MLWSPFVANREQFLELALTAKTFGVRPSSFLTDLSAYAAYCLDVAAAYALAQAETSPPTEDALEFL